MTDAEFQQWHAQHIRKHKCEQNHHGSVEAMEPAGTVTTFCGSEELYNLQYSGFLGDGDSKAYSSMKNADPPVYNNADIKKYACSGHVQKRIGRHLMHKVAELKQKTFMHTGKLVKGIGNKGGGGGGGGVPVGR